MSLKSLVREVIWISGAIFFAFLFAYFLFGFSFSKPFVDIHLSDTYLVVGRFKLLFSLLIFVLFWMFAFRVFRNKFSNVFANWIMLFSGVSLLLVISLSLKNLGSFLNVSLQQTLYPPLSKLGSDSITPFTTSSVIHQLINIALIFQVVIIVVLLFLSYKWGKTKKIHL